MLISYRWLQRHVDLTDIRPEEVAEKLTLHTAEVEAVEPFLPHLAAVCVGHVLERDKHPDADKLSVCSVDVGDGEPLQIVCGAPNVRAGFKVAVATVGTLLPGDFKIKKSKIRGIESRGMICSERELGLGEEHAGIWELPAECRVGEPVSAELGAEDWLIEIDNKSLTHRPDLWGHRGIAAEVAALFGRELDPIALELPPQGDGEPFDVRVEHPDCSRYLGLAIDGVRAEPSPLWLRQLLLAVGQRPIDLLVDISNFVMLDLGQPNHLFDRSSLPEGIVVRKARAGEVLTTLDEVERKLVPDDLLICSGEVPVALAGVMGGHGSAVEGDTDRLLLEVACFDPVCVRRTSARLGLRTDASTRFEKHLDPTLPLVAAAHLVNLLRELQPSLSLPAPLSDAGEWTDPACTVPLRGARARAVLGAEIPDEEIERLLTSIGFGVERDGERLRVQVPSARATKDVSIEEDLIEEVGRLYRYDRIPEQALVAPLTPAHRNPRLALLRRLEDRLSGTARYHQVQTYSFVSDELCARVGAAELPHVEVQNPVAEGQGRIRRSVVPSLLGVAADNLVRREPVRLYEVGKGYLPEERDERHQPREVDELGLVLAQPPPEQGARFDAVALRELQGVLEDLVAHLECPPLIWRRAEPVLVPTWAHPGEAMVGWAAGLAGSETEVAFLANPEPGVALALGIACDASAAWVSIPALLELAGEPRPYRAIPRFPGVKIDVAIAGPEDLACGEIETVIRKAGKGLVSGIELFDLYTGENLGEDRRSLAWHVLLQAPDKTLSDKEVARYLGRLEREVIELGAELRRE